MDENYIRRERQRKAEVEKKIKEMRGALKVCTMDEIRMAKMPHYEAVLINMEENGYCDSANFIKRLMEYQSEMRERAGVRSNIWIKPQLRDTKNILQLISDELVKADDFKKDGKYEKQIETFLKMSVHIAFSHPDWWWLGEQLLLECIRIAKGYSSLGGKLEAISRYAYGKFLVEDVKETETAYDHLSIVRELSMGKKWTTHSIFPDEKDIMYSRACYLLHYCLMDGAHREIKNDFVEAIKLTTLARKRAAEACFYDGETRALILKGVYELSSDLTSAAITTFTKAYYIQERHGNLAGICETRLRLAQAYLMNGDGLQSFKILMLSKDYAEENNLNYHLAQAYKFLGEFYLNNGEPKRATPLLGEALKILYEMGNAPEIEHVRNMEAVSTGLELFPKFVKLLSNTDRPDTGLESLMKMIEWKNSRKPFWSQDDESEEAVVQSSEESEKSEQSLVFEKSSEAYQQFLEKNIDEEVLQLHINLDNFQMDSDSDLNVKHVKVLPVDQEKSLLVNAEPSITGNKSLRKMSTG